MVDSAAVQKIGGGDFPVKGKEEELPSDQEKKTSAVASGAGLIPTGAKTPAPTRVQKEMKQMISLLNELERDLDEDISGLDENAFRARVESQFECFVKITDLRRSLKEEVKKDSSLEPALKKLTQKYKEFIQTQPSFREAAQIKKGLEAAFAKEMKGETAGESDIPEEVGKVILPAIGMKGEGASLAKLRATAKLNPSSASKQEWKTKWRGIQKTLLEGAQRAKPLLQDPFFKGKKITWLSGTTSASLVPILRMPVSEIGGPALIPTGQLLRYGIVPLAGELKWGIQPSGFNLDRLSGVGSSHTAIARKYATASKKVSLFDFTMELELIKKYDPLNPNPELPLNRVKIAVLRLQFAKAQGLDVESALNEAKLKIRESIKITMEACGPTSSQWESFGELVRQEVQSGERQKQNVSPGMVVGYTWPDGSIRYGVVSLIKGETVGCVINNQGFTVNVLAKDLFVYTDEELKKACEDKKIEPGKLTTFQKRALFSQEIFLKECLDILEGTVPTGFGKLSQEDEMLIRDPAGLIFGAFTEKTETKFRYVPDPGSHLGEVNVLGPQKLGEDIQVVFVEETNLEKVKEYIQKNLPQHVKVHVVGMKALSYLAGWSILPSSAQGASQVPVTERPPCLSAADLESFHSAWGQLQGQTDRFSFEYSKLVEQRYVSVGCPQQTAVEVVKERFIHANWVRLPGSQKTFIASQAPLPDNMGLFWKLALDGVMSIMDLSNEADRVLQGEKENVQEYCPIETEEFKSFTYGSDKRITVRLLNDREAGQGTLYTYYVSEAVPGGVEESRPIMRYRFPTWKDDEVLPLNTFKEIVDMVDDQEFCLGDRPVLVHCHAGVGRTGCVIAAIFLKEKIFNGEITKENFFEKLQELILELRKQRGPLFVQKEGQFNLLCTYGQDLLAEIESATK